MQINQLPSTSTVNSTDVLVKETSGGMTEKIAIGNFVVNNLTSTATDKPLSAAQGKALNDNLATKPTKEMKSLAGNSNTQIQISGGKRYLISIFGYTFGLILARGTSDGIDYRSIYISSEITISTSGNTMTINNSSGTTKQVVLLDLS